MTARAPGANRTRDTRFRRAVLYPLSYEGGDRDIVAAGSPCQPITSAAGALTGTYRPGPAPVRRPQRLPNAPVCRRTAPCGGIPELG